MAGPLHITRLIVYSFSFQLSMSSDGTKSCAWYERHSKQKTTQTHVVLQGSRKHGGCEERTSLISRKWNKLSLPLFMATLFSAWKFQPLKIWRNLTSHVMRLVNRKMKKSHIPCDKLVNNDELFLLKAKELSKLETIFPYAVTRNMPCH
jgi:hypothetical protein